MPHTPHMILLRVTLTTLALLLTATSLLACESKPKPHEDSAKDWTLIIQDERYQPIAELSFHDNQLVKTHYHTQDQALRDAFQAHLDATIARAQSQGLMIKFHETLPDGARGYFGAEPKPGEERFTQAMYEHLSTDAFHVRVK